MALLHSVNWPLTGLHEEVAKAIPPAQRCVPMGMYLVFAYRYGLTAPDFVGRHKLAFAKLEAAMAKLDPDCTPGHWYLEQLGGEVEEGFFMRSDRAAFDYQTYLEAFTRDYAAAYAEPTPYHVPDDWEVFREIGRNFTRAEKKAGSESLTRAALRSFGGLFTRKR